MPARPKQSFLLISLLSFLLVLLPYLWAAVSAGPTAVFGGFLLNPIDGSTYLAKMLQGYNGAWQFTLPYTAEPGPGAYLFLFYIFLGHLSRVLGLPLIVVFHAARLMGALALFWSLAHFIRRGFTDPAAARLAYALAALGSGLGWLAAAAGALTADFWVAEAYPFLSAFANPHFAFGLALLLWLLALDQPLDTGRAIRLAAAALLLSIISPFGIVVALVVLGGLLAWEARLAWRESGLVPAGWSSLRRQPGILAACAGVREIFQRALLIAAAGLPVLVYDLWVAQTHPQLAGWNAQNLTPSPPLWDLVLSTSPALLLAAFAVLTFARGRSADRFSRLLLVWAVLGILLLYLPFSLQRRFMTGLYVPLALLAAMGVQALLSRHPRRARPLPALLLLLSLPTNLLVLLAALHGVRTLSPELYLTQGEAAALSWMAENTPAGALVLAAPDMGLYIPAHSGRRVLYGHPFETVNAAAEKESLLQFFQADSGSTAGVFLQERDVDYLFWGPRERSLAPGPVTGLLADALQPVYDQAGVVIYAVEP